ncbi:protein of unknown function (plasmid) [Cupriavidus taiwanensis]|uniref:Uncharacterized protein n=1 Tax=Cupriavidus taiwanensis TaxID=164546 RepID=A0A375HDB3_9BURK|nr:protein of unknown function [Cupriavidus taiwanensis]SPA57620.1 protein of unknown function [Cupriavidus taiwanensis]SPD48916.1 protein of unknown function [Cupriavidus taiwanensis]
MPRPFILPISAVIAETPQNIARYDHILECFSKPLMRMATFANLRPPAPGWHSIEL